MVILGDEREVVAAMRPTTQDGRGIADSPLNLAELLLRQPLRAHMQRVKPRGAMHGPGPVAHGTVGDVTHGWTNGGATRTTTKEGRAFRRDVLRRDHYTCQRCGHHDPTGKTLDADHDRNVASDGVTTIGNGVTLCRPCHRIKTLREAAAGRAARSVKRTPPRHPGIR